LEENSSEWQDKEEDSEEYQQKAKKLKTYTHGLPPLEKLLPPLVPKNCSQDLQVNYYFG
jgi:hypothetical protein